MSAYTIQGDLSFDIGDEYRPVTERLEKTGLFATPDRFRTDLEKTRLFVDSLARDVSAWAPRLPAAWRQGWTAFLGRWGGFVWSHPRSEDIRSTMTGAALRQVNELLNEAWRWRTSLTEWTTYLRRTQR